MKMPQKLQDAETFENLIAQVAGAKKTIELKLMAIKFLDENEPFTALELELLNDTLSDVFQSLWSSLEQQTGRRRHDAPQPPKET